MTQSKLAIFAKFNGSFLKFAISYARIPLEFSKPIIKVIAVFQQNNFIWYVAITHQILVTQIHKWEIFC